MKSFIKNITAITIPFIVYLIIIVIMDPFNYLKVSGVVDDSKKWDISMEVQPHLYRMIAYEQNPRVNIALGDSRTNSLFCCMDTERWSNLSFAGASIKEMVDAFWWAMENHKADTVLIGLSLNNYNKFSKRFWVEETISTKSNFFSYAFNRFTFICSWLILKSYLTKNELRINDISMTRDEFWQYQISETPIKLFGNYAYPDNYFAEFEEISHYCAASGIKLIFWIPPEHQDYQGSLEELDLLEANQRFKQDLYSLGEVYDYNYLNELTQNREIFLDPLHLKEEIIPFIRDEITGIKSFLARHHIPG